MENPVKKARLSLGLSVGDLSLAIGVSRDWIYMLECGHAGRVNSKMQGIFSEMGINGEQVADEYDKWKKEKQQQLRRVGSS